MILRIIASYVALTMIVLGVLGLLVPLLLTMQSSAGAILVFSTLGLLGAGLGAFDGFKHPESRLLGVSLNVAVIGLGVYLAAVIPDGAPPEMWRALGAVCSLGGGVNAIALASARLKGLEGDLGKPHIRLAATAADAVACVRPEHSKQRDTPRPMLGVLLIWLGIIETATLVALYCELQPELELCDEAWRERQVILERGGYDREKLAQAFYEDPFLANRASDLEIRKRLIHQQLEAKWGRPSTPRQQFLRWASSILTLEAPDTITTRGSFIPGVLQVVVLLAFGVRLLREKAGQEPSLWPAKGVLVWAGILAFTAIFSGFKALGADHPMPVADKVFVGASFLGSPVSIAVCAWWYDVSKRRRRRATLSRGIGYVLFLFGATAPIFAVVPFALILVREESQTMASGVPSAVGAIVFGGALVAGAYHLVFRPPARSGV